MAIMVTGGAGFIGSHICRYLISRGEEVVIFDGMDAEQLKTAQKLRMPDILDRIKVISGDICSFPELFQTIRDNNINKIIHAAAITFVPTAIGKPGLTFRVNVEGTFNILEAARILNLDKVLYVSTSSVYGDFRTPIASEDHPLEPKDIYGASKLAADRLAISYNRTYGMDVAIARTTSVYGPGDMENRATKIFIENALTGKEIRLEGGGLQKRDFSYVKDVARGIAMTLLSDKTKGEVLHIAGGQERTVKELAELVTRFIPNVKIVETPARNVTVNRGRLDISKAERLLGYRPEYALESGLKEYIKWFVSVYAPFFEIEIKNRPVIG